MSNAAYAEHRGITKQYVGQLIKKGILKKTKKGLIDPAVADPILDAYREPAKMTVSQKNEGQPPAATSGGKPNFPEMLMKTRIKKETEQVKLLEIKAKVEAGKYIDREEAESRIFNHFRPIRDGLLTIPDRLDAELAATNDRHIIHKVLYNEIVRVLDDANKPVFKKKR